MSMKHAHLDQQALAGEYSLIDSSSRWPPQVGLASASQHGQRKETFENSSNEQARQDAFCLPLAVQLSSQR